MTGKRSFGISTHLFHGHRLTRDHLQAVAAHGFESVEIFATQTHVDYHNPATVADLQQWLAEASLELRSVHAPTTASFTEGRWGPSLSLASTNGEARAHAVSEAEQALQMARRIPFKVLVVHLGVPRSWPQAESQNSRDAARRSVEALHLAAGPLGVRIALEIIPNELSRAASLVHFIDAVLDVADVGICLDFGHAHMDGDLTDAIETVSEHLVATHLHDNRGRADEHLVPFEGTIGWPSAMTALQKVGYDETLMLEIAARGSELETLKRAKAARQRIESLLADW